MPLLRAAGDEQADDTGILRTPIRIAELRQQSGRRRSARRHYPEAHGIIPHSLVGEAHQTARAKVIVRAGEFGQHSLGKQAAIKGARGFRRRVMALADFPRRSLGNLKRACGQHRIGEVAECVEHPAWIAVDPSAQRLRLSPRKFAKDRGEAERSRLRCPILVGFAKGSEKQRILKLPRERWQPVPAHPIGSDIFRECLKNLDAKPLMFCESPASRPLRGERGRQCLLQIIAAATHDQLHTGHGADLGSESLKTDAPEIPIRGFIQRIHANERGHSRGVRHRGKRIEKISRAAPGESRPAHKLSPERFAAGESGTFKEEDCAALFRIATAHFGQNVRFTCPVRR